MSEKQIQDYLQHPESDTVQVYEEKERYIRDRANEGLKKKNYDQAFEALKHVEGLKHGASITDFPCGPGHHADFLVNQGFNVTAIDGSNSFVEGLKSEEKYKGLPNPPHFKRAFYKDLDDEEKTVKNKSQDAFFCFGESWGFEKTLDGNLKHLENMYKKVKPGGTLVIQGRYTPSFYKKKKESPSMSIPKGDYREVDGEYYFSKDDGDTFENYISEKFCPHLDDNFRQLEVWHNARMSESGELIPWKSVDYMKPKLDKKGVPMDYPVLRAFCEKLGFKDVHFYAKKGIHYEYKDKDPYYICSMVIKKPSGEAIHQRKNSIQGKVRSLLKDI